MADYRRMGGVEQHLRNATSTTLFHQLSDLWKSSRGTVLRIEALALVAIVLSFFLAAFGSCRRWSNRWIVQKGFLAAQVLSLSLGTYSIGLMQSSSVKSDMYPIWAVSLLTLFGCVDPITTYNGLDYKGPLLKVIFQLCLYCGYVLLMSVPTISTVFGNLAIGMLCAITFIKGFHRSMALVLPSRLRNQIVEHVSAEPSVVAGYGDERLEVHLPVQRIERKGNTTKSWYSRTNMADIRSSCDHMLGEGFRVTANNRMIIEDVCLGYSLSHLLRCRFLGLDKDLKVEVKRREFGSLVRDGRIIDYKRTLKAIEFELAFIYEVFFTGNEFLQYHEAKTSSFWALVSFMGICLVGIAAAIPGTMASHRRITASTGSNAGTVVVDTTTVDLIITLVILISLALLQLVQLIRCWASNWARVAFACEYATTRQRSGIVEYDLEVRHDPFTTGGGSSTGQEDPVNSSCWIWMRLKAFVCIRINWIDQYLWQDKLGQYSLVAANRYRKGRKTIVLELQRINLRISFMCGCLYRICDRLLGMLGLQYMGQVLRELWVSSDTGAAVRLHDDVKASVVAFLGQIKSRRIGKDWLSLFDNNGIDPSYLPCNNAPFLLKYKDMWKPPFLEKEKAMSEAYAFSHRVMVWHVATWYCKKAEQEGTVTTTGGEEREKNRRVAIALSKYCAYLVVSAPELLRGPSEETKLAFLDAARKTEIGTIFKMTYGKLDSADAFETGVYWGEWLRNERGPPPEYRRQRCSDPWEVLALLWVQTLLYAAPFGDMQAHLQHVSQGGEFITHLWALLYHIGIDKWEHASMEETKEAAETAAAGDGETTTGTSDDITQEPAV